MRFITKMIFYLVLLLLVICIYSLFTPLNNSNWMQCLFVDFNGYKEGITQNKGHSSCSTMNKQTCLSYPQHCDWNSKLHQCSNRHNCFDLNNETNCNQQKYCIWSRGSLNEKNTCSFK